LTTTIKVKGSSAPADIFTPPIMDGYQAQRGTGNTELTIPGRSKSVVFFHPTKARKGTFQFVIGTTDADVAKFDTLIARKVTFTLTDTDRSTVGMDFVVAEPGHTITLDDETRGVFVATVPYLEV